MNCDDFIFTTGGDGEWYGQVAVTHDGEDAAQSGAIANNEETWMETSVDAPGDISFWWKVSSEAQYAPLEFYINGVLQDSISGNVDWQQKTFELDADDPGYIATQQFVLRWRYFKNRAYAVGADAGWVDQLSFVSADALMVSPSAPWIEEACSGDLLEGLYRTYTVRNTSPAGDPCDPDLTPPVITLVGGNPVPVECGGTYTDAGATALDNCDGDLTASIVVGGDVVEPMVTGTYVITYDVSDSASNAATQVTRTVNVEDTALPTITLLGDDPALVECGSVYTDAGATADDACDGDVTADIVVGGDVVDTAVPGDYTITYNVSDASGNAAVEVTRTVTVQDTTEPAITLVGPNPHIIDLGEDYYEYGAMASDVCDGDLTAALIINASEVYTGSVGVYAVYYDVSDTAANAATQVTRTVEVVDTVQPYVTLVAGDTARTVLVTYNKAMNAAAPPSAVSALDPANYTLSGTGMGSFGATPDEVAFAFGYTYRLTWNCPAIMVNGGDITITVNAAVQDSLGNAMLPQGVFNTHVSGAVADMPMITVLGDNPAEVECGAVYSDGGATAADACGTDISGSIVTDLASVNTGTTGAFQVLYDVTDGVGNAAVQAVRTVNVVDSTLPVITLIGSATIDVDCGSVYNDAGATADDSCEGDITDALVVGGDVVDTDTPGIYIITYDVSDASANAAAQVIRTVTVLDNCPPAKAPAATKSGDKAIMNWTVTHGAPWLSVTPSGGMLPGESSEEVTALFTAAADSLPAGVYEDTLVFRNTGTGWEVNRRIVLRISDGPPTMPAVPNPLDGAQDVSPAATTLSWSGDTAEGCLTTYTLTVTRIGADPPEEFVYNSGTEQSYMLPLLAEGADYSWKVTAENCCGVTEGPTWTFTTGYLNALVYFVPSVGGVGVNHAEVALQQLDFSAFSTGDVGVFETLLADPGRNWEVVIVDVQGDTLEPATLNALTDYYDNRDGRIIFAHSGLDNPALAFNDFLQRAGIEYLGSYPYTQAEKEEVYVWQADPLFTFPNALPSILITTVGPELGHYVGLRGESKAYAGYTFGPEDGQAAIIVSGDDRIVVNAFSPQNVTGDQDNDGSPDMVELYKNELVVATPYGCDPDVTPPEISLLGANPLTMECGEAYESPGAYAFDFCDRIISNWVAIDTSMLDVSVVGAYTVYYSVTDSSGNTSETLERAVEVVDTTAPLISLLGANPITLECGYEYQSPGAFALDACDGVVNDSIVIDTSQLDIGVVGDYIVYYSVTDGAGNTSAVLERIVFVVDSEAPIITLVGDNPQVVECGAPYVELGATAVDACSGDLNAFIEIDSSAVDPTTVGTYEVIYTVVDGGGNTVEAIRTVEVADSTAPVIDLGTVELGEDGYLLHECSTAFVEPEDFAVLDVCDGDLGGVQTDLAPGAPGVTAWAWALDAATHAPLWENDAPVVYAYDAFTAVNGDYLLVYIVVDVSGNVYPELDADGIPVALFDGATPNFLDVDGTLKPAIDFARLVRIEDTTPPAIELLGDNPLVLECAGEYVSPGVLSVDACDGDISANVDIVTTALDMGTVGEYNVLYSVTDASGNTSEVLTRVVQIEDTTIPVITLLGDAFITIQCGDDYVEPGAAADDACDGDISDSIVIAGVVDVSNVGTYVLTYNVSDGQDNAAVQVLRVIYVEDTLIPEITLLGDAEVTVECGDPYEDAGATAADHCDGDLTAAIVVAGDQVLNNIVGVYVITYNVIDGEGQAAVEVTRTVTVEDNTIPVITRLGDERIVVECADVYDDPGATADDHCDGDITDSIVTVNPVDTAIVGEYVVTYNVADGQGNAAVEVTRTVEVVNTTVAVINLPDIYVPVDCVDEFDGAFAALDSAFAITAANPCGDLTADIRVTEIKVTYPRRGDSVTYTVASLNAEIIREGKIAGFEGDYTGTIEQTIILFKKYFVFKPAIYLVTYAVQEPQPTEITQIIRIDDQCRGCLGCYSCDSCAQYRPTKSLKDMMSDWLLVGLSMLVLAGFANRGKKI